MNAKAKNMSAIDGTLYEKHWIAIKILNNHESKAIKIKNAKLEYGKFYRNDNKDVEIPANQINNKEIQPGGGSFTVSACGRAYSPSGTQGSFELVEANTDTLICQCYWNAPYLGAKSVDHSYRGDWFVVMKYFDGEGDALGKGELVCYDSTGKPRDSQKYGNKR